MQVLSLVIALGLNLSQAAETDSSKTLEEVMTHAISILPPDNSGKKLNALNDGSAAPHPTANEQLSIDLWGRPVSGPR